MPCDTCPIESGPGDSTSATLLSPAPHLLVVRGSIPTSTVDHLLHLYGSETGNLIGYSQAKHNALERITSGAPDVWAQVYHAICEEWALTAEDLIYRRTTLGLRGFDTPEIPQRISGVLDSGAQDQPTGLFKPFLQAAE
jgi:glycerol-3-phosphate dehydrogenase